MVVEPATDNEPPASATRDVPAAPVVWKLMFRSPPKLTEVLSRIVREAVPVSPTRRLSLPAVTIEAVDERVTDPAFKVTVPPAAAALRPLLKYSPPVPGELRLSVPVPDQERGLSIVTGLAES